MTPSGKSLFYFGIYGISAGLLFVIIPAQIISLTQLPPIHDGWTRMIGLLALVIGTYDIVCGKADLKPFIKASIYVRFGFAVCATVLVILKEMPFTVFLIGLVDALGATWTLIALSSETKQLKIRRYINLKNEPPE
jgi:hypothetical protein